MITGSFGAAPAPPFGTTPTTVATRATATAANAYLFFFLTPTPSCAAHPAARRPLTGGNSRERTPPTGFFHSQCSSRHL